MATCSPHSRNPTPCTESAMSITPLVRNGLLLAGQTDLLRFSSSAPSLWTVLNCQLKHCACFVYVCVCVYVCVRMIVSKRERERVAYVSCSIITLLKSCLRQTAESSQEPIENSLTREWRGKDWVGLLGLHFYIRRTIIKQLPRIHRQMKRNK